MPDTEHFKSNYSFNLHSSTIKWPHITAIFTDVEIEAQRI